MNMTSARITMVVLMWLVPTAALAHGPNAHPADPKLHVDPAVKDCSVRFAPELTQAAFGRFAREFGSVSAFKLSSPPTTLGKWHVAVDLEQIWFSVEEKSAAWNDTFVHPDAYHELGSNLGFPKLRARVGLTDDLDVGAFFSAQPTANYGWLGLDAKYRLLKQTETMPISLSLRGAYTKTLFVSDMDMHAITTDVAAGRTFWNVFTPYLGLGNDLVLVRETTDAVHLHGEAQFVPHALGGFEVRYWHVALGAEAHLATLPSFQVQLSAML
jgi:hypothetical protein